MCVYTVEQGRNGEAAKKRSKTAHRKDWNDFLFFAFMLINFTLILLFIILIMCEREEQKKGKKNSLPGGGGSKWWENSLWKLTKKFSSQFVNKFCLFSRRIGVKSESIKMKLWGGYGACACWKESTIKFDPKDCFENFLNLFSKVHPF